MIDYAGLERTCSECGIYHPCNVGPVMIDGSIRFLCFECS